MMEDTTILNARVQFLDVQLTLVHIPIALYSQSLHPILQLLMLETDEPNSFPFVNISINHIEVSVVLPKAFAAKFFERYAAVSANNQDPDAPAITIAPDDYILIFVSGSCSNPSQRVIDLTTPIAMAGIPIFFFTTYHSDFVMCPRRSQGAVIAALKTQGFELSEHDLTYSNRPNTGSSDGSGSQFLAPGTPPPSTLSEMQIRTFNTLKKRNVEPTVDREIRLVQCGSSDASKDRKDFLLALIRCLLAQPKFFSLTLAEDEAPSVLLEERLIPMFERPKPPITNGRAPSPEPVRPPHEQSMLNGTTSGVVIPIVLDLRNLPLESTGIVCGVAGRLVDATKHNFEGAIEMGYLSTAKAGTVMVLEADLDRAVAVLAMGAGPDTTF